MKTNKGLNFSLKLCHVFKISSRPKEKTFSRFPVGQVIHSGEPRRRVDRTNRKVMPSSLFVSRQEEIPIPSLCVNSLLFPVVAQIAKCLTIICRVWFMLAFEAVSLFPDLITDPGEPGSHKPKQRICSQ